MTRWIVAFFLSIVSCFGERDILKAFEEEALSTFGKHTESYRFTYVPTFDKPCVFRLNVISEDSGTLVIKRLSKREEETVQKLEIHKTVTFSGEEYQDLLRKLRNPKVWKPFGDKPENGDLLLSTDGEGWTLEGIRYGIEQGIDVLNPSSFPWFVNHFENDGDSPFEAPFTNFNPFFQATFSMMLAASNHFTWEEKGIHDKPFELVKTAAFFQSPSFRQALEILEREESLPEDDPFAIPKRIDPTTEEREKAHAFLKKAIEECPGNPEPYLSLAISYIEIKNHTEAEKALSGAKRLAPKNPKVLWLQGGHLSDLRRFNEANEVHELLKTLDSDLARALKDHIEATETKLIGGSK